MEYEPYGRQIAESNKGNEGKEPTKWKNSW
jgi:hypothetical protein